ncbi:hypothetical protein TYRP_008509 [Tyrophagus putrescentiae]|nr:hypothetical protein TYRP_008509 [Tyrophagus putrescentiae]
MVFTPIVALLFVLLFGFFGVYFILWSQRMMELQRRANESLHRMTSRRLAQITSQRACFIAEVERMRNQLNVQNEELAMGSCIVCSLTSMNEVSNGNDLKVKGDNARVSKMSTSSTRNFETVIAIDPIDWCHLVDRNCPTVWDTTRKLVMSQAVGADQPNDTSLQHLGFTWLISL